MIPPCCQETELALVQRVVIATADQKSFRKVSKRMTRGRFAAGLRIAVGDRIVSCLSITGLFTTERLLVVTRIAWKPNPLVDPNVDRPGPSHTDSIFDDESLDPVRPPIGRALPSDLPTRTLALFEPAAQLLRA